MRGGMRATTVMVTAVVTAVTDIADAEHSGRGRPRRWKRAPWSVRLPYRGDRQGSVTLRNGIGGAERGAADSAVVMPSASSPRTLPPGARNNNEEQAGAGDLTNTVVKAGTEDAIVTAGDNDVDAAKVHAVDRTGRGQGLEPIKAVTGTLKAVRNGIRAPLGPAASQGQRTATRKGGGEEAVPLPHPGPARLAPQS